MEKSNNTVHVITAQPKCSGEGVQFHSGASAAEPPFVHTLHCLARKGFLNWLNVATTVPETSSCSLTGVKSAHWNPSLPEKYLFHKALDAQKVPSSSHQQSPSTEMAFINKDIRSDRNVPNPWQVWEIRAPEGREQHPKSNLECEDANPSPSL